MSISRRQTLALLGGGVVIAAAGGAATFAGTRTPHRALAPWAEAGTYGDVRLNALSHAILAPNPHNMQPWVVELVGEDSFLLHVDRSRLLPQTDPFNRQITIGLGCFLAQMEIAASQTGHGIELTPFPEGTPEDLLDDRPVAHVRFIPDAVDPDPLFAAIPHRRSTKEPFDMTRPVSASDLSGLTGGFGAVDIRATTASDRVAGIRELMWDAWLIEYETPATLKESVDVMRFGRAEINAAPDGIDLGGAFLEGLMMAGLLNAEQLLEPGTTAYSTGITMYREMLDATPAAIWLTTPGNSRVEQLAAGRAWLRLNLQVTAAGLALHPVSQALQEFPEMAEPYARAHAMLAPDGGTVQMLGRIGFADAVPLTPRWSLHDKLVTS
ncbi:Acg family FMN-binding oxidoreductase [Pontivivens insulae]|uniref:NAD(P)H nitroreductase n=1 Tax=Pontivivens insulae TaxID=1639689 RepID=A0A2R8AEB9_9RHOB|nr:twin-arginine translocation pathway signal protein [Pontivivens insulae]RED11830.1 hypothetical protein DFR53_2540 [Pontivivens insulae]SPF30587.1 Putative NAD(P)H nitroreductase [Pontivivens insulae]